MATAGHVDHGKSTLVRLLTGTEPDRLEEERRRGLTIDLGFAWADLDGVRVSFVDVPGHEHFAANLLAGLGGLGPRAGVVFVVAADDGWSAQSEEHARVVAALGLQQVLLVVTKCDLVDGATSAALVADCAARLSGLGLEVRAPVRVSGVSGAGLDDLRAAVRDLALAAAVPDASAPVRLWVDRVFTVSGAGTVVTGTLAEGSLRVGDELVLRGEPVRVRGLHTSDRPVERVVGVARVAVNLRAVPVTAVSRGDALLTPSFAAGHSVVDSQPLRPWVADQAAQPLRPPREAVLHAGTAAVPARVQRRDDGQLRLRLAHGLPLRPGDRAVLRDPGRREVLAGLTIVALDPPTRRDLRAAAHTRARLPATPATASGTAYDDEAPAPPIGALVAWLAAHPLRSPARADLAGWGVTARHLAEAEQAGLVLRVGGLVLQPDSLTLVREALPRLGKTFRPGDVASALGTSRAVVVALLERLDTELVTRRLPDGSRELRR